MSNTVEKTAQERAREQLDRWKEPIETEEQWQQYQRLEEIAGLDC